MSKITFAGACPLCSETLTLIAEPDYIYYECPGKEHFCGIAPSAMSIEEILKFDLSIHTGDLCPTCQTPLKIEGRYAWCESSEHLYGRQTANKEATAGFDFGGEWIEWNANDSWYPEGVENRFGEQWSDFIEKRGKKKVDPKLEQEADEIEGEFLIQ